MADKTMNDEKTIIRALFFDLDGTLLTSEKTLAPSTREALRACREKGISLFIATARTPLLETMLGWTEIELGFFDGGIYCNGACEKLHGQTRYAFLPAAVVAGCVKTVESFPGLHLALQLKDELHAFNCPLANFAYPLWGIDPQLSVLLNPNVFNQTVKILIYFENLVDSVTDLPSSLVNLCQTICMDQANVYLTDQGKVLQITNSQTSKFKSIDHLRRQLNLKPEEIAVFGDDWNDLEMLTGFPNGVVMGNADRELRCQIRYQTQSNDEDGIAYALHTLMRLI